MVLKRVHIYIILFPLLITTGFSSLFPTQDLSEAGETALAKKDYANAVHLFREAYERDQGNIKAAYNLANAYHFTGEYSKAESLYNQAIETAIENGEKELLPALHYNLGNTFFKKDEFEKAIENYKIALEYDDNDLQTKKNYELALRKLQKYQRPQSPPQAQNQGNSKGQDRQQNKKENTGGSGGEGTSESQEQNRGESDPDQTKDGEDSRSTKSNSANTEEEKEATSEEKSQRNISSNSSSKDLISLKRAEQILNAYENRQKRFESYRKYKQTTSKKLNTKNW